MSQHPEIITEDRITTDTVHRHNVFNEFKDGMTVEFVGPREYVHGTDHRNELTPNAKAKLVQVALQLAEQWPTMKVVGHWDWCSLYWGVTVRFEVREPTP